MFSAKGKIGQVDDNIDSIKNTVPVIEDGMSDQQKKQPINKARRSFWKWTKRILIVFGMLILTMIIIGSVRYIMNRNKFREYAERPVTIECREKIDLVGLMDSYGVPYSPSVSLSFFDQIKTHLENNGRLNSSLDLYNLYINKTWQFNGIFENGVTIGEFKDLQQFAIDFTRHKYPEMIKEGIVYSFEEEQRSIRIYDYIRGLEHPVVLYSCAANDLFYYYGQSLEGLSLQKIMRILSNLGDAVDRMENHVRENIKKLLACNPNAKILVMGLYLPSDNYFLNGLGHGFLAKINRGIASACDGLENAHYVDVSMLSFGVLEGDFHPNQEGQHVLAVLLSDSINANCSDAWFQKDVPTTSWVEEHNEPKENVDDASKKAEKICDTLLSFNLPMDDYVECAVAIENALYENHYESISYYELEIIKDQVISALGSTGKKENWDKAFAVEIAEKHILYGVDETENALSPEGVKNDKMSMIDYY